MSATQAIPHSFIWRRLHSLTGLWLVLFLIEHLLLNSQAALFFGDDGNGFIKGVNSIKALPYLSIIEIILLGIPFFIHIVWGMKYLFTGKFNSFGDTGKDPYLPQYPRNRAYTWQRITSWILLVGVIAHVIQMRFMEYPESAQLGLSRDYMVRLGLDDGLYTLAERLDLRLYNNELIELQRNKFASEKNISSEFAKKNDEVYLKNEHSLDLIYAQKKQQEERWLAALKKRPLHSGEVIAVTKDFGTAELLMVRETFKMPLMIALYTIFVLAASFHAFNGLWTFLITWGVTLTQASQRIMLKISTGFMILIAFIGLSAIWGTYWINLKQ
jgi:succinate dehydrogenase / fumarate reductase, cytochrome b subunit